jgi:hypothetical protein
MSNNRNNIYQDFFQGYVSNPETPPSRGKEPNKVLHHERCAHWTFEKVPRVRANVLLGYLRYSICAIRYELPETNGLEKSSKLKWLLKNREILKKFMHLNSWDACNSTDEYLAKKICYSDESPYVCYGPLDQPTVERLYSRDSLQNFPKEIRSYLLQDEYSNFKIIASKPRILAKFAEECGLDLPILRSLVLHRESTLGAVSRIVGVGSEEEAEEVIDFIIDSSEGSLMSLYLPEFFAEILVIRDTLLQMHNMGLLDVLQRKEACLDGRSSENLNGSCMPPYGDNALKHVLQDVFCRSEEKSHILKLMTFLKDKHSYQLLLQVNSEDILGEVAGLSKKNSLCIIPFFDSIYVGSTIRSFQLNLESYINQYNDLNLGLGSVIYFQGNPMESRYNNITDPELFYRIHSIDMLLKNISRNELETLITKLGMPKDTLHLNFKGYKSESEISGYYYTLCKNMLKFDIEEYDNISEFVENLKQE